MHLLKRGSLSLEYQKRIRVQSPAAVEQTSSQVSKQEILSVVTRPCFKPVSFAGLKETVEGYAKGSGKEFYRDHWALFHPVSSGNNTTF
jgi:hypothetical protein